MPEPTEIRYNELPPHDLAAEEAVLGSCFIDFEALAKVAWLRPEDFYREKNQWVFSAMLKLHQEGKPTNQIIVGHALAQQGKLEAMGGAAYISECIRLTPTSVHVKYYADIVKDCAERRQKLREADKLVREAYKPKLPTKKLKAIET